jgi:hypothetical protein
MILKMYQFSPYIVDNKAFLEKIAKSRSESRVRQLINSANTDQLLAISEIILNILDWNFPLKSRQRRKLSKNVDYYKRIASARSVNGVRKHIQQGGQLGAISAILAPVIGAIAQHLLDKNLAKQ